MHFFRKDLERKRVTLYPIGDIHLGSRQSRLDFVEQVVAEIKADEDAVWVGMGDLIENALDTKMGAFTQTLPPYEQADHICDLLAPIADKGLFLIAGNHEQRTMRTAGFIPEQHIAAKLRLPYKGYSCFFVLELLPAHTPRGFTMYFHHNYGGGYTGGGKVNRAAQLRKIAPTVDATFSGHFHVTSRTPSTWFEPVRTGVMTRVGYDYIIGSALEYDESYAEERAKNPATLEFIKVTFIGATTGKYDNRQQIYEVIVPEKLQSREVNE